MSVRACCPLLLCICLAGCQGPRAALFPWTDDTSTPSLAEAELEKKKGDPSVNEDAFADSVKPDQSVVFEESSDEGPQDERGQRIQSWLIRGREAIRRSADSPRPSAMLTEATQSFREVLKIDPNNADAYHGMAIVSDLNKDWELADISYKRALAIRPDDVDLLNDQGYSYLLQDRFHEASQYLNRVLKISPGHEKAHTNLAILDLRRGNSEAAMGRLVKVYTPEQARMALASLAEEHGASAFSRATNRSEAPLPGRDVMAAGPRMSAGPRITPRPGLPPEAQQITRNQIPVHAVSQQRVTNAQSSTATQPPLFNSNGVIQMTQPSVQTVGAAGSQVQSQAVSAANMQRHPGQRSETPMQPVDSPMVAARSVGGNFQMPPNVRLRRPQLPVEANVYNPAGPPSGGFVPSHNGLVPSTATSTGTGYEASRSRSQYPPGQGYAGQPVGRPYHGGAPGQIPSQPYPHAGPQSYSGTHGAPYQGAPVGPGANSYQSPPANVQASGVPARTASNAQMSADGRPISIYPSSSSLSPRPATANDNTYSGQTDQPMMGPGAMYQGVPGSNASPRGVYQPAGMSGYPQGHAPGVTRPSAWPQSVPGGSVPGQMPQHGFGSPAEAQAPVPGPQANTPAPLAPQYFSPPPVMGNGYQSPQGPTPNVAAPDVLSEYRAAREQLKNEYDQTLQRIGAPGGRSFQ